MTIAIKPKSATPAMMLAGLLLAATPLWGLEVDEVSLPRITFEGEFISTLDYLHHSEGKDNSGAAVGRDGGEGAANLDDSNLFIAFDKHLYSSPIFAGFALRLRLEESLEPFLFGFLGGPRYRFSLGGTRLRNSLVRFPTVREEDLLTYTHVLNGSGGIEDETGQIYGNNIVLDWFFRPSHFRVAAFAHGRARTRYDTGSGAYVESDAASPNGLGLAVVYDVPGAIQYEFTLRRLGLIYEIQQNQRQDGKLARQSSLLLGGVLALGNDPEAPLEAAFQYIATGGLDDRDASGATVRAGSADELGREASAATVLSFQFTNRKYLQTRWRAGLTLAHKSYGDINGGTQYTVAPAAFWRVSSGLDLVAQVLHTSYDSGLAAIYGRGGETRYQIGLSMVVEAVINDEVVDYGSILEMEHGSTFQGY